MSRTWVRRYAFRLAALAAAAVVAWRWSSRLGGFALLPSWSPFVAIAGALGSRQISWVTWLGLPLIAVSLWKGRWFCRHVCPTGLLLEGLSRTGQRFRRSPPSRCRGVGRMLAALTLGGALLGVPWFLCLDPLVLLNGALPRPPLTPRNMMYALGLGVLGLWSLRYPWRWCGQVCPLGATQEGLCRARRKASNWFRTRAPSKASGEPRDVAANPPGVTRRAFVALAAGAAAGLAWRGAWTRRTPSVIRPPGSAPDPQFQALCARCGNCLRVCPAGIIRPDVGGSGWSGLLTPALVLDHSYCSPWCNACTQVCPTGAIRRLSEDDKRQWAIGKARVDRQRCLAWAHGRLCMVCQEFCHYHAIRDVQHGGVPCPEVIEEACRGCGACQSHCPAIGGRAIKVHPVVQHRVAATEEPPPGA